MRHPHVLELGAWRLRVRRLTSILRMIVVTAATATPAAIAVACTAQEPSQPQAVRPGIDVLLGDSAHVIEGLRVGLITNPTGVDAAGRSTIDRLRDHAGVELVRLFAPEHGLRATQGEGETVLDGTDPISGLRVVSLYGSGKRTPSREDLAGLDAVVFDMQDIGARYFTYVYTMALAMEAVGAEGLRFIVLDRPNPIGGDAVQGNVLDPAFATFVGRYPIPMRHGMTPGELARLFRDRFGIKVELSVIPVEGWERTMYFDATGLPWIPPSPNMPSLESALHYPGLCLFEGTSLSVGRGTAAAFQQIGAPGLDPEELIEALAAYDLPGVRFEAATITPQAPTDGKFDGIELPAIRLWTTDRASYDPTRTAIALLIETRAQARSGSDGDAWKWNETHFDRLAGTDQLRIGIETGLTLNELTALWTMQRDAFAEFRLEALLYGAR